MRILIADDERITRITLARQLQSWGHDVTPADDGQHAWDLFAAGEFDLVLTDWEMPRLSGPELVHRIRNARRPVYTYVIILTGRKDKADVVAGIEAGADDFVSKPWDRDELRVRLLAGQRIVTLERALLNRNAQLQDANDRIHHGLRAAARVQQSLLPRDDVTTRHVRTAWKYVPTDELAGDAIGLHLIADRYLVAYVLDVSGHGVPAALLSVTAMHALAPTPERSALLRDFAPASDSPLPTIRRPAHVATELNRRFPAGEQDGRFLTMILCALDTHTGQLLFTSAGHPAPLLLRAGDRVPTPDVGSFPLAIVDGADYDDAVIQLRPNDRLCLFSDGVVEQTDPAATDQFGEPRLLQSLLARRTLAPEQVVIDSVQDLTDWAAAPSFTDDVSLVLIDWLGPSA